MNGILYVNKSGRQWRMLPHSFGHWNTIFGQFCCWFRQGVLAQVMASGLPLVATRTGGNVELVDSERDGAFIAMADLEALANLILEPTLDEYQRARRVSESRRRAVAEFSLFRMVNDYRGVFEQALPNRG